MSAAPRRLRRAAAAAAVGAVVAAVYGCTSTVTPPADVDDPTTVYLLREAMHTGVVLPPARAGEDYVEFGYGDWSWFALGNDAWYHSFATVLWPTQGALGRRTFRARDGAELVRRVDWAELIPLEVSALRVEQLRRDLLGRFEPRLAAAVSRPELGWTFVPADASYWFANTCADVAAEWFVALGCEVGWAPIRASLWADGTGQ